METLKYAVKHGYSKLVQDTKKQAIGLNPMDTFLYAVGFGDRDLVEESGKEALYHDPVEVFRLASEHGHVNLARIVADKSLSSRPNLNRFAVEVEIPPVFPTSFEKGAEILRTDHIFSVLKYATEHKLEDLMSLAALVSKEKPNFTLAVNQLNYAMLTAWVSQSD